MLVTVGVGATASQHPFEAHVTITNDRYPTQQTISIYQTLDRAENFNQSKTIYSGDSFKLTISETAFHHRTLGRVFSAEITLDQKSTPIKMYCSPGSGIGNPATSGSNRS